MQHLAHRFLICGMHVHVGVEDPGTPHRSAQPDPLFFTPCFGAQHVVSILDTGLKSHRVSVFDEMPRTGFLEKFDSYGKYD